MAAARKIRVGIVGTGKVGDFHARALLQIKDCELCAAFNHTKPKLDAFCKRYGIRGYLSLEEMIKKEKLDAITVCTPHPSHAAITVKAADLGCHVLVEKPLAVNVDECDAMIEAGERNHVLIGTLVQRRNYVPCMRIRKAIDSGLIGKPILGEVAMLGWRSEDYYKSDPWRGTWKGEGGGVLMTQASHQIDLLNWYMGRIESVYGLWANYSHPYIEVEDSAVAVIRYQGGGLGTLLASNSQNPALYGKVHIFGSNGAAVGVQTDGGQMFIAGMSNIAEPPVQDLWSVPGQQDNLAALVKEDTELFNSVDSMIYFHRLHLENFINAILGEEPLLADAEAGRATVEVCQAVYEITQNPGKVWVSAEHRKH